LTIPSAAFTCLAVETATDLPSVALVGRGLVTCREAPGLRAPSRHVFEWVQELLDASGIEPGELDCIAYGAGPGSFTGVRVAVALAQGLGYACGVRLCPVSTLAALAAAAFRAGDAWSVACCLDAHMGEVYVGTYARDAEAVVRALQADVLAAPAEVTLPGPGRHLGVGPGWRAYPDLPERLGDRLEGLDPALLPSAIDVAAVAEPLFRAGRTHLPAEAQPNYLRHRVAVAAAIPNDARSTP
jgi:tRNA threonylcarbamoyladenosine biosynthesis protein TsaB